MKTKTTLICLLIGLSIEINGQTAFDFFHPMIQEGKLWKTIYSNNVIEHLIEGDTIIDGTTWKKAFRKRDIHTSLPIHEDFTYFAAIREEGLRVYAIAKGMTQQHVLYDFSLKVGDRVECASESKLYRAFSFLVFPDEEYYVGIEGYMNLESIDTIQVRGQKLRRFIFKSNYLEKVKKRANKIGNSRANQFAYPALVWIEGIGSDGGPFLCHDKIDISCRVSCYMNDNIIFDWDDFYVDGVTDGIKPIEHSSLNIEHSVFNLQGQQVNSLQKGLNIVDGKKVWVK